MSEEVCIFDQKQNGRSHKSFEGELQEWSFKRASTPPVKTHMRFLYAATVEA